MDLKKVFSPHDFFQQVRMMLRWLKKTHNIDSQQSLEDKISFISPLSLDAPKGEAGALKLTSEQQWQLEVQAHGLTGVLGALPTVYTEWLIERHYRYGDNTAKAFLDIFNHRLHTLRYLAWQKYHFYAMAESSPSLPLSEAISALSGIAYANSPVQQVRFASLFGHSVRSMLNLETWLKHTFGVVVKITPFTGKWRVMEKDLCCRLGDASQPLKTAPMLGSVCWDRQSHFTAVLGPIAMQDASLFLPEGKYYNRIWMHIREYVSDMLEFDIDLLIEKKSNARTLLGQGRLGLDICLGEALTTGLHKIRLPLCQQGQ